MSRRSASFTILAAVISQIFSMTSMSQILIDESFDDWTADMLAYTDATGDTDEHLIDLTNFYVTGDSRYLYLRFDVAEDIILNESDFLTLIIDVDNDSGTGMWDDFIGGDIWYDFGNREGLVIVDNTYYPLFAGNMQMMALPSVSGTQFEIAISRSILYDSGVIDIESSCRIAMLNNVTNGDLLPDTGWINYEGDERNYEPDSMLIDKSPEADLRLLTYNVLSDGLFNPSKQAAFSRIFNVLRPDIFCLQEIYDYTSDDVRSFLDSILPLDAGLNWEVNKVSPDVVLASRYPITGSISSDGNGVFTLDVAEQQCVVVNAHLPCCENDEERQLEIDRLLNSLRNARDGLSNLTIEQFAPIIIAGDMNFVGEASTRNSLLNGDILNENLFGQDFYPDWDSSSLEDANPLITNKPGSVTWVGRGGNSFPQSRLDYLLYSGSVLEVLNSFCLDSESLIKYGGPVSGLMKDDTGEASDHYPCVADFKFKEYSTTKSASETSRTSISSFPNPVSSELVLRGYNWDLSLSVEARDFSGKLILKQDFHPPLPSQLSLKLHTIASGVYLIHVRSGEMLFQQLIFKN